MLLLRKETGYLGVKQPRESTMTKFAEAVRASAFVLIALGTVGLLANEFVFHWGRTATLWFALSSAVGLVVLGLGYWNRRKSQGI